MIATTLEQSRKLVELGIDTSTADMHYAFSCMGGAAFQDLVDSSAILLPCNKNRKMYYEPAWSLAALMEILPSELQDNHYLTLDKEGKEYCCCYEDNNGNSFRHCFSDNPVDACVEMIEKLHELKIL